jgi:DNA-binding LacI/PurR family transcriptional regulator
MTILDVAKVAGVSKSTVSRVINGHATVKPEIARQVRSAMDAMGYTPPLKKRGPKPARPAPQTGIRTGNIGFLILGRTRKLLEFPSVARTLSGFTETIQAKDLVPIVIEMPDIYSVPEILTRHGVDGVVIIGGDIERQTTDFLSTIPSIWQGGNIPTLADIDLVTSDNRAAGILAARHLLQNAGKDLAYINHVSQHLSFAARRNAFVETIQHANIKPRIYERRDKNVSESESWEMHFIRATMTELLETMLADGLPDGIFVPTDQQCAMLHTLLRERGITPETDTITISCNNDANWLTTMYPRPASIDLRTAEQGRLAAKRLLERITTPTLPPILTLVTPQITIFENPNDRRNNT